MNIPTWEVVPGADHYSKIMKSRIKINVMAIMMAFMLLSCGGGEDTRKIFFINSYHVGYPSSDGVTQGIQETLAGKDIDLEIFYLDTKQHPAVDQIKGKVKEALRKIEQFSPDVVIASDDNAVKYLVAPYLDTAGIPVVFCGVNWSAEQYGLGRILRGCWKLVRSVNASTPSSSNTLI